ncbi:MAG: HEPN domain-containing protein [Magnetococcales bacterium]|nr:HEPN domain-containing protein [Magnetococcales bacterium]
MKDLDSATLLLTMAQKDLQVAQILLASNQKLDESIGFHAQQAVEKALKAWLAILEKEAPRTHNLRLLILLLEENGVDVGHLWDFAELSPFAIQLRYETLGDMESGMDLKTVLDKVEGLIRYVNSLKLR